MIDNATILLICGGIVLVVWRAVRLDAELSWFTQRRRNPRRSAR